jgi:hypothetical protein
MIPTANLSGAYTMQSGHHRRWAGQRTFRGSAEYSFIGGGVFNTNTGYGSVIGSGDFDGTNIYGNTINANAATIQKMSCVRMKSRRSSVDRSDVPNFRWR